MGYNDKNQESRSSGWFLIFNGLGLSKAIKLLKMWNINWWVNYCPLTPVTLTHPWHAQDWVEENSQQGILPKMLLGEQILAKNQIFGLKSNIPMGWHIRHCGNSWFHTQTQLLGFDFPYSPFPSYGTYCRTETQGLASPWAQICQLEKWGSSSGKQDLGSGNEIQGWRKDQSKRRRSKKVNSLFFGIKGSSSITTGETNLNHFIHYKNSCLESPAAPK